MSQSTHSLIVGGGVIGLSLAWELAQRGQTITLLDAGNKRGSASWAGAGILPSAPRTAVIDPYDQLQRLSQDLHPVWARRLREGTGIDTGFQACGGIYLACTAAEEATLMANQFWWEEHGIAFQRLPVDSLVKREPALRQLAQNHLRSAWFLPEECQLRNPRHLKALRQACQQAGVQFKSQFTVDRLLWNGNRVSGVACEHQSWAADQICICSGAWAREVLDDLRIPNGIMPIRGQMLLYQLPARRLHHIINEGNRYLVPRDDNRLLAGSIEEEVGYQDHTTEQGIAQIRSWAERILPELKHIPLQHSWSGLRPGSFDGLPYLGKAPGFDNLFVASGHFRSGLTLSCATAAVMADLMCGQTPSINLHPFRIGRG